MVQMVTPSPTPSADGLPYMSTPAVPNTSSPWPGSAMSKSTRGQWHYGTPPLEDGYLYSQNSSTYSTPNDQLAPSRAHSQNMNLRARGSPYRGGHLEQDDEREYVPPRRTRAAKRATAKSNKNDAAMKYADFEVPLSVWGEENNLQPLDVVDFATRHIDERVARAAKDGYIKRSLNPFFLYKKAFSKVGKAWMAKHRPHEKAQPPLVSLVGLSWQKESEDTKDYYNKLSKKETDGLKEAFPNYRYKPGAKKALVQSEEEEQQQSVVDDFNALKWHRNGNFMDHTQGVSRRLYGIAPEYVDERAVLPSQEPVYHPSAYGMPPMPTVYEAGPMITDQANSYLYPGRPGWALSMHDRAAQSVSPAPSQLSYQTVDHIPIDPSLPDAFSDYAPSREASEEPGFVAPSQLTYSRMPSAEPMLRHPSELDSEWISNPAMSRCASEEPWQGMSDAFLSSLPSNDMSNPSSDEHYWHLESLEKNEPLQGFAWDAKDWEHEFDDDMAGI